VGGEGDDLLIGGNGRDLLIGGVGADRLVGNADDDILIAGSTAFDGDAAALRTLMAEWTSDRSYGARVADLMGDVTSHDYTATRLNGSYFLRADSAGATVFDDLAADVLTGSSGQDWFLFNADGGVRDRVTDLSASEFQSDTNFINGDC
jgi:fibronectin-binding autotransporter adhesin